MTLLRLSLYPIGLLLLCATSAGAVGPQDTPPSAAVEEGSTRISLEYKTYRDWQIQLPAETFSVVSKEFPLIESLGRNYAARVEGTALAVDSDGDGEADVKADGTSALVTFQGATKAGRSARYSVRLVNDKGWKFAAAGAMTGKIDGTKIQLIDQNNNGRYCDYGEDAMIVGRGDYASFLSRVINVDGRLLEIDVSADGSAVAYHPYQGASGILNLGKCDTKAKLLWAVIRNGDGTISFDAARAEAGLRVPVGAYTVATGELGLGTENRVQFRTGRSKPMQVEADGTREVSWGGPVHGEFAYHRQGDQVALAPTQVWYYGAAGEEYHSWSPKGQSPKFTFTGKKSGREFAIAYFPGSC